MKYPQVALSPSKLFLYVWTKENFIFVRGGRCVDFAIAEAAKFYKMRVNRHATDLELLTFPLRLRDQRRDVVEVLMQGLRENLTESELFFSKRSYSGDSIDKQILTDLLYCINENQAERKITFDETANAQRGLISEHRLDKTLLSELSGKKVHKQTGRLERSLSCQHISSYVAGSEGITFKMIDGSLENFGSTNFDYEYEFHLNKYLE